MTIKKKYILWKMGYYSDQYGIINRYLKERENWDEHIIQTKKYILQNVLLKKPHNIAILGSGWLIDIPLAEIINNTNAIHLIDIIHPSEIINRFKHNNKIFFVNTDLTGGLIEQTYRFLKEKKRSIHNFIKNITPYLEVDLNEFDMVISVNILNQLDILLKDKIRARIEADNKELNELSKKIQDFHIQCLPKGKTILISDFEELLYNHKKEIVKTNQLVFTEIPGIEQALKWQWKFDTMMNYNVGFKTFFNVIALQL